jgi:hypothetical protein
MAESPDSDSQFPYGIEDDWGLNNEKAISFSYKPTDSLPDYIKELISN